VRADEQGAPSPDGTSRAFLNLDWAANYWNAGGAPKNKLVVGLGTYARCFTTTGSNALGAPVNGACQAGPYTREAGFLAYYEICDIINAGGQVTYNNEQQAPYVVWNGNQWAGYDNAQSLRAKTAYQRNNNFLGWMTWNADLDDFTGTHCNAGTYPLLRVMNEGGVIKTNRQ